MGKFVKAAPKQARLKVSIYGAPGSGKTFTTLLMAEGLGRVRGKRVAYVDTERGTDFYAMDVAARKVHPKAFDFDAIYTRSISEVSEAVFGLDPNEHGVVVIDSISHIWDAAMDAYGGGKTSQGGIPMHAWGAIKRPYKTLINFLVGSPFDIFILGRQKNLFEHDADSDEIRKVGVAMRAEGETAHEPHLCLRMEGLINPKKTTQSANVAYVEKDRTGVLMGKTLVNPDFSVIEPLLPLLGEEQAPAEDADERAAQDAEALAAGQEALAKSKIEKSLSLYRQYAERLASVATMGELGELSKEAKKTKRYLTDEHEVALRELFVGVRERLTKQILEPGMAS